MTTVTAASAGRYSLNECTAHAPAAAACSFHDTTPSSGSYFNLTTEFFTFMTGISWLMWCCRSLPVEIQLVESDIRMTTSVIIQTQWTTPPPPQKKNKNKTLLAHPNTHTVLHVLKSQRNKKTKNNLGHSCLWFYQKNCEDLKIWQVCLMAS